MSPSDLKIKEINDLNNSQLNRHNLEFTLTPGIERNISSQAGPKERTVNPSRKSLFTIQSNHDDEVRNGTREDFRKGKLKNNY